MLAPDIEALLAPQRRFEELRERTVRRAGARVADLSYANAYGGPNTVSSNMFMLDATAC